MSDTSRLFLFFVTVVIASKLISMVVEDIYKWMKRRKK